MFCDALEDFAELTSVRVTLFSDLWENLMNFCTFFVRNHARSFLSTVLRLDRKLWVS